MSHRTTIATVHRTRNGRETIAQKKNFTYSGVQYTRFGRTTGRHDHRHTERSHDWIGGGSFLGRSMELRITEDEVRSLTALYESLYTSTQQHASTTKSELLALPRLPERAASASKDAVVMVERTAVEIMEGLESFRRRVDSLQENMDKFRKRLTLRDPLTDKPRYGEQTSQRVVALLENYQDLCRVVGLVFGDRTVDEETAPEAPFAPIVDSIRQLADEEIEEKQRFEEEQRLRALSEEEARQAAIEHARREDEEAAAALAQQEREAAEARYRQAAEARMAIQRAQEQAAAADQAWVNSIPKRKTLEGVKVQLKLFSESCSSHDSLNALYTIFSQIVANPEEDKFRRIRRDHVRFLDDIGQYAGGKELLIAAGFELGFVEEIPSFVCKEPDVEKDLDGWSAWFDLLKGTLEHIEQEMIK
jgi:PUB domain